MPIGAFFDHPSHRYFHRGDVLHCVQQKEKRQCVIIPCIHFRIGLLSTVKS